MVLERCNYSKLQEFIDEVLCQHVCTQRGRL